MRGFSLAEVLVVIAMVALIGVVITELFFRSFLGSNKASVIANIKQNGQLALETIDKTIRSADNIISVCPTVNSTTILIYKEGVYTRFKLNLPVTTGLNKANGYISSDNKSSCEDPSDPLSETVLTDKNISKGVSVTPASSGVFKWDRQPGFKDVVTIDFFVGPGISAGTNLTSSIDPVEFKTTIELR